MDHDLTLVIKLTRIAKGLRQEDLAQRLGVNRSRVSQLETGRSVPGAVLLDRLATALDSTDLRTLAKSKRSK